MNHPSAHHPSPIVPPNPASNSVCAYVQKRTGRKLDQKEYDEWIIRRKEWNERSSLVFDALVGWAEKHEELHVGVTESDMDCVQKAARAAFWEFSDRTPEHQDGDSDDRAVYAYRSYCQTLRMRRTGRSTDVAQTDL